MSQRKKKPISTEAARSSAADACLHLLKAHNTLDAACRDLCGVVGAAPLYRKIAKLSRAVRDLRYRVEANSERGWHLDGEPAPTHEKELVAYAIIEHSTGKSVDLIELQPHNRGERAAERVLRGLLLKVDTDRFYVSEVRR